MATSTKAKNGNAAADTAAKAAEDAKVMVDTMIEAANKAIEDSKPLISAQQKIMQDSFALWQDVSKTYFDFFTKTAQQTLDQSLAYQNDMLKMAEDNMKKGQKLMADEQAFAFNAMESYQAQVKAASEQAAKVFTPVAN
jgi:TATA-binding protein-associated factor Taf7